MKGRRHLTPQEIKQQMNLIARESRMAERSTWTAMSIMFGYSMMKGAGFKGKRINDVIQKVNELYEECEKDPERIKAIQDKVEEKTGSKYEGVEYTDDEIQFKKGTYAWQYNAIQIPIQNRINAECLKYMLLFNFALIEMHGFGFERLERVNNVFETIRSKYVTEKQMLIQIRRELYEDAGILMQNPEDTLDTKYEGSLMLGKVVC